MTAGVTAGVTPTLIVGGYLGAGKTTLVNHLLRHADGRRIAVMVNDFGELTIDADLIEGAEGSVLAQGSPEAILDNADVRRVYLGDSFKL